MLTNGLFMRFSIFKKYITEKEVDEILNQIPYESLSILEAHYLSNNCFVEEGYVLNNINKIEHISTFIIHGNEDVICPLKFAIELDSKLKNSKLFVVDAGHSDSEPEIEKKLVEIINTCF
jgi:proline iminopeptidase